MVSEGSISSRAEHRKHQKRFVMVWSFNGRISGCLPEDMGSIPMQIANRDPFVNRLRHRAFNPGRRVRFPQGLPICIRNSIGRVRSLKPKDAGSKPAGCTIMGLYHNWKMDCIQDAGSVGSNPTKPTSRTVRFFVQTFCTNEQRTDDSVERHATCHHRLTGQDVGTSLLKSGFKSQW